MASETVSSSGGAQAVAPTGWQGAWAAFGEGFEAVKKNPTLPIVYAVLTIVFEFLSRSHHGTKAHIGVAAGGLSVLTFLVFMVAQPRYELAAADGDTTKSLGWYFSGPASVYVRLFFSYLLAAVLVIVGAIPLLIPLIWVLPWISMMALCVIDQGLSPVNAFKASKALTGDHKGMVWGLIGVAIVLSIVDNILMLIPAIGWLLTGLVGSIGGITIGVAIAKLYRFLQTQSAAPVAASPSPVPTNTAPPVS